MKITQNQNNNLLIIRFLCKFAHRTTVQILEGFRLQVHATKGLFP